MDNNFWRDRWASRDIRFHEGKPNQLLTEHLHKLNIKQGDTIFVPLCGKTVDMSWLHSQGFNIIGVELVEDAVREFFAELKVEPSIEKFEKHSVFRWKGITIISGDFFALTSSMIGSVQAVYDRAAVVALPPTMRVQYAKHLADITCGAKQLAITFIYEQDLTPGPPFSVDRKELNRLYSHSYRIAELASTALLGGLKGLYPASEHIWILEGT